MGSDLKDLTDQQTNLPFQPCIICVIPYRRATLSKMTNFIRIKTLAKL